MNGILPSSRVVLVSFLAISLGLLGVAHAGRAVELEEAAKREGKLRIVVFPSLKKVSKVFEKKYGIKIEGTYVGAPPILRKVGQESDAGIFATDVFTTAPGPTGNKLNKWALAYTPMGFEKVAKVKKDLPAGWNQVPLFIHVVGVIYNRDLVPPKQVPKSIYDLLKPEFKGKIISRTSWLGSNFLVHILSYYTWFNKDMNRWRDYWSRFKENVGRYEAKFPAVHFAVGLKEFSLGVFTLPFTSTIWGRSYPGLTYSTFKEGGIWWPNMAVIHKKAPHPNAAKLFVNFLVSDEGQRLFSKSGLIPANKEIPPKDELKKALEGIKLFNGKLQGILTRETQQNGDKWKARIQKIYR
ncbi:MAG: ABC transporter substrate-binding protein [Candidatus Binatia bacterium]